MLQLPSYSVLHSLRIIECFENNTVDKVVKLAIDVLRKCAENAPTITHGGMNNQKSPGLKPRLVRLLRYAYSHNYGRTASDFVPVRIEEFPVKL